MKQSTDTRPVIHNKKASHNYFIEETYDCGLVLKGNEVKSIYSGMANINNAWCEYIDNRLVVTNMFIAKWDTANAFDTDERRKRPLLLHKKEINKIVKKMKEPGCTVIPLKVYWHKQYVKMQIGICRGKHNYDKRETLKQKDIQRQLERYR